MSLKLILERNVLLNQLIYWRLFYWLFSTFAWDSTDSQCRGSWFWSVIIMCKVSSPQC